MALANGKSLVRCREITLHTKTAIHIAEQFTDVRKILHYNSSLFDMFMINFNIIIQAKFSITQLDNGLNEIICEGIGLKII